ncbi:MAG: hypothetical protein V7L21_03195 [Nostoc sp.]
MSVCIIVLELYSVRASSLASILKPSSGLPVATIALNLVYSQSKNSKAIAKR